MVCIGAASWADKSYIKTLRGDIKIDLCETENMLTPTGFSLK